VACFQWEIGLPVIEFGLAEIHDIRIPAKMFPMTGVTAIRGHAAQTAVKALPLLDVPGNVRVVVAGQAFARLSFLAELLVAAVAIRLEAGVGLAQIPWHQHLLPERGLHPSGQQERCQQHGTREKDTQQ